MGKFFDKIRQVFNIFLISFLIAAASAVVIYFLTSPEQRNINFWISVCFLGIALVLETLMASGIAMRFNSGKNIPATFSQFILGTIYFIFVIAAAFWNAISNFSTTKYVLIHIIMLVVFLVPMVLINMMVLRLSGSDRNEQDQGRKNLNSMSNRVNYLIQNLKNSSNIDSKKLLPLEKLSDDLKYSDPSKASRKLENALDEALKNLENSGDDLDAVLKACNLAQKALKERNENILNSK